MTKMFGSLQAQLRRRMQCSLLAESHLMMTWSSLDLKAAIVNLQLWPNDHGGHLYTPVGPIWTVRSLSMSILQLLSCYMKLLLCSLLMPIRLFARCLSCRVLLRPHEENIGQSFLFKVHLSSCRHRVCRQQLYHNTISLKPFHPHI